MLSWPASQELLDQRHIRFYQGRSMAGTFRPGDCLTVMPARLAALRPGDVIVFRDERCEDQGDAVVHRVLAVLPAGLVTRGDNNPGPDQGLVTENKLLGRVTHRTRAGRTHPVAGGRPGLLYARLARARRRLRLAASRLARRPYGWLRASRLVPLVWRPTLQAIHLNGPAGPLVKYVCHGSTVARWWPQANRFECRKPYDLLPWSRDTSGNPLADCRRQ